MVVWLTPKVKQAVLTAVCRSPCPPRQAGRLFVYGEASIDPGGSAAVDVADRGVAELLEVAGRGEAPLAAMANGQDRAIPWHFVHALLQLPERDQLRARHVSLLIFPRLAD